MAALPDWLDRALLSAGTFYPPDRLPAGGGAALRAAARTIAASLVPPAGHDERTALLNGLRLATHVRAESRDEAVARFRLLRRACADLSAGVLGEACRRYARAERFFPTAIADLLAYTATVTAERRHAVHRLERLAALAEAADAERARLAADPATPAAIAAIKAEFAWGGRHERGAGDAAGPCGRGITGVGFGVRANGKSPSPSGEGFGGGACASHRERGSSGQAPPQPLP